MDDALATPPPLHVVSTKLCECGCGQVTPIAKTTSKTTGRIAGRPLQYIHGHTSRGKVHSQSSRDKRSIALRGRIFTPEWRAKIAAARKRQVFTAEQRAKTSARMKGNKYTLGHTLTPEHRAKVSASLSGKKRGPLSKEQRAKISETRLRMGLRHTPESRAAISRTQKNMGPESRQVQTRFRSSGLSRRDLLLRREYNMTEAQYLYMFDQQGGLCAICKKPPEPNKVLHVDHNHVTGVIRGLLHGHCNRGLGFLRDDANALQVASLYILSSGVMHRPANIGEIRL